MGRMKTIFGVVLAQIIAFVTCAVTVVISLFTALLSCATISVGLLTVLIVGLCCVAPIVLLTAIR